MELTAFALWLNTTFAGFDRFFLSLYHSLSETLGAVLTPLCKLITLLGEKGLLLILLALVLMLFARTRPIGVCMFGAIACGALLTNFILKDLVARPRPFVGSELYAAWWQAIGAPFEDEFSFPSGHMTAAVAGLCALCLTDGKKWLLPSALWALLMAVSRNYLMAHYPSDVLFGALVGLISAFIAWGITNLIFSFCEAHDDWGFCAFLLDWSLPLRRAGHSARRERVEEEEPAGEYRGKHCK